MLKLPFYPSNLLLFFKGTISCRGNQSPYLTGIKNTTYVEANVLSMYAKFRLHPLYGF